MKELLLLILKCRWKDLFLSPTPNGWIQLFRYGFVGGIAFIVDFTVYCLLAWLGLHYLAAGVVAFLVAFAANFCISRVLIFQPGKDDSIQKEIILVLIISGIGLLLTELLLFLGVRVLEMDFRVSKIAATIIVLFWNYFARKMFVYK